MEKSVNKIVNNWDPIGLFPSAPKDEYKDEIKLIENFIAKNNNVKEVACEIQRIFLAAFTETAFDKSFSECLEVAKKILGP